MKNSINAIYLLSIFFSIFSIINGQIIIPMKKNLNSYYIKIFYDKDKKDAEFVKINMALDFTFIPLPKIIDYKIHSENELIEIDNNEYITELISYNNLYLENNFDYNLDNFDFYSINKTKLNNDFANMQSTRYINLFKGQFGLSPILESDNTNILYILKQKQLINKMSFGLCFNYKNENNDILFFGEIEEKIKNDLLKNRNIITEFAMNNKLLKKYNKWGFKLDAIVVEKNTGLIKNVKHKYFAYFNIIEDRIFVPDKIMEYLISRIFNNYIKNKICFVTEYSDKKFINCYKKKINKEKNFFPNIIFVVDNYSFKLTFNDLFINSINSNEIIFIIQKNYYDIDTSIILFGSRFIKKYITEFDIEQKKIIFHSENILPRINLAQIDDDSWKDMIRDYNKEIEHYDSNYGNEKEVEEEEDDSDNNENIDNINNINNNDDNNIKTDEEKIIDNNKDNNKKKEIMDYKINLKYIFIVFIIIIIIASVFIFLKVRKKIRINKEKDYFKEPLEESKYKE